MTKIIFVGDPHLRDRPPSSCTDVYPQDLLDMLEYVAKLEKELKVDAVVWAGDVFDHKQPAKTPHKLVLRAIEVASQYDNLYAIAGNHDLTQDRMDSLFDQQPLGVLLSSGYVKFLDGWAEPNNAGIQLPLFGVSWQQRWNHEGVAAEAFSEWRLTEGIVDLNKCVAVTHCAIYPPGEENEFDFFPTSGIDGMSAAMGNQGSLYYGHIHEYHGTFNVDGVSYANMGALSRGSLTEANRTRPIKVALWTEENGFTEIAIPHRPANEIFKIMEIDKTKAEKLSLDNFLSDVGESVIDITDVESVKDYIWKRKDVEEPVRTLAVEMIEKVN